MTAFAPKFGSYEYAAIGGIYVQAGTNPMAVKPRQADTPARHGSYSAGGLLAPRVFTIQGLITGANVTELRGRLDGFRGAHKPGLPQAFYFYDDRYCYAEVTAITDFAYDGLANSQVPFAVEFTATDPFDYDTTVNTTTGLASGGTVTAGGTAPAAPLWTLVVSSVGTNGTVTITNTTTGEALVLAPTLTGTYLIDSRLESLTRSSVDVSAQANGVFPWLAVGANTITVSLTGSLTLTSLSVDWANRYY